MSSEERILVFIPAYNCGKQIPRVLRQLQDLPSSLSVDVLVLDNRSPDDTVQQALTAAASLQVPVKIARNRQNYGLGGSHKAAFKHAVQNQYDYVVVLHGDDQGSIRDLVPHLLRGAHREYDAFLGARFMEGSRLEGYSRFRTFGNRVYNLAFSAVAGKRLFDLGSGLNVYKVNSLARQNWLSFANDLTFNYYLILAGSAWEWKTAFFPISWREDDQVSNVKLFRQARQTAALLMRFALNPRHFLSSNYVNGPQPDYEFDVVGTNAVQQH